MDELIKIIKTWISEKKVGSIQINFFKGGIPNINISESIKLDDKVQPKTKETLDYGKSKT